MLNNEKSKIFNSTSRKFTIYETWKHRKLKNVDFEGIKQKNYKLEERKSKNYETKPKVYKILTIRQSLHNHVWMHKCTAMVQKLTNCMML